MDTGTQSDLIDEPEGRVIAHGIRGTVSKTIAAQLAEINVDPDDIAKLALSHAHYDHVGNCRLFRSAEWIVHTAEYDAMFGSDFDESGFRSELYDSLRDSKTTLFDDDYDVFGDGAVRIISTPGHTPGHCSLFLNLPQTGKVLLSGDIDHNRRNFQCRCVPSFNVDKLLSIASMDRLEELLVSRIRRS